jgi:diketogulonate reductase-like aldo/keto reductase
VFKLSDTSFIDTWKAMEKLLQTGKTKAIGVSNFNERRLKELLVAATVVPAVNQIEAHPYIQQPALTDFCRSQNILIEAYSPLGNNQTGEPRTVDDSAVHEVAKDLGVDAGQVLASWGVQRGTVVLPKSVTEKRIISNREVKELPQAAFDKLNALERHKRFNDPSSRWGYDIFDEVENVEKKACEAGPSNLEKFKI